MRKISRETWKKEEEFLYFFFFGGGLQIDRLVRGETVVFAVELDEVENNESCSSKRRWQKERQRDRSWRAETDSSKRSETRETTKRNLFGGRTLERRSCDVGCHQASSYKCIPSFTQPTLSFTRIYPPVFALPEFDTDGSSHLRSKVNRHNKV